LESSDSEKEKEKEKEKNPMIKKTTKMSPEKNREKIPKQTKEIIILVMMKKKKKKNPKVKMKVK